MVVNPFVQRVPKCVTKEGKGVLKVELRAAEVDPLFEMICCDAIAVSIFKDALPILVQSQNRKSQNPNPISLQRNVCYKNLLKR